MLNYYGKVEYLILGAGPAGLSFACQMKRHGNDSFLVLEKEENAGGLCRSMQVDGSPFDIGGGHFLDVLRPKVNEFLFTFMPEEEWSLFRRDSKIYLKNHVISHPIEANIWQLPLNEQVSYLESIASAGSNIGEMMPDRFTDWIYWKLGERIAEDYMLPYNRKMFGEDLDNLGTYWLDKLPNVSFRETLLSCLSRKAYGTEPGHTEFYYPKHYGYGEVWLRMADFIKEHIVYGCEVSEINFDKREVTTKDGEKYRSMRIITTIPWSGFDNITGVPQSFLSSIRELKSSSIETRYYKDNLNTDAHWIYCPDENVPYHRILVRHNFCAESHGYWTETRVDRRTLSDTASGDGTFSYMNQYAYPLNTANKPMVIDTLLSFAKSKQIYGLGRWGEHSHYNSDVTVERALRLADLLSRQ